MAGQLALWQLLDHALGHPNQSTVDLSLLKDFLLQFLIATNQAQFIVNATGKPLGLPRQDKVHADVDKETSQKALSVHVEQPVDDEKTSDNSEGDESRIEKPEMNLSQHTLSHEDSLHRSSQPADRLPSGAELLETKQSQTFHRIETSSNGERPGSATGDNSTGIEREGTEKWENFLTNTWNTVRVNKRLQALEDGVDKLFAILDILTAGQNEMRSRKEVRPNNDEELSRLREDIDQLRRGEMDLSELNSLKENFDTEVLNLKERLGSIESLPNRLDEIEGKLADIFETHPKHDKRLSDLEDKFTSTQTNTEEVSEIQERPDKMEEEEEDENELRLKSALLDIEDLKKNNRQEDIENMAKNIAEDVNKLKKILDEFVTRREISDVVRWPQLEDALNVKRSDGSKEKIELNNNQDAVETREVEVSADMKSTSPKVQEEEEEVAQREHNTEDRGDEREESIIAEKPSAHEFKEMDLYRHPSAEIQECLQKLGDITGTFVDFESKVTTALAEGDQREKTIVQMKKDIQDLNDTVSSIKQVANNNTSMIEQIRADFSQFVADCDFSKPDSNEEELNALKEHVGQLESRGNRTSLALNDLSTSLFNELKAKQNLIDALFECVDGLQRNKVDIDKAKSIFDLEAYKSALDSKVNMNQFDEMMMELNANLQEVFQKLDKYASEEESLKDALDKLSINMKDKLDAKAEKSLKKYLESRIAQLKKSRENLVSRAGRDIISNAAGFRRPLSTLFHCISCDRPVHIDGYEDFNTSLHDGKNNGNKEQAKIGAVHSASLDALHGSKSSNKDVWRDPFAVERYCGGNYTAFMQNPKKQVKTTAELPPNAQGLLDRRKREKTIVKFLLGTDGQVYRGRYKMTDLRRAQYQSEIGGRLRSRSAEAGRSSIGDQQQFIGSMSNPPSLVSTPRNLPPIGQDVLGVKTSQITDRYDVIGGKLSPQNDGGSNT